VVSRNLLILAALAALLSPASAAAHTDAGWQVSLRWPAQGTITSPYGRDGYRWHPGLDIGSLRSLDVRAAAPGRVRLVGAPPGFSGYGTVVTIGVGGGFETLYAHLSTPRVRPGQVVEAGDPIGLAGCTGWCTGTHLHFELRYRGRAVDPTALLPR
jgi:murein DD-endopeptidase MepM/ murein hydrolase activator NlpD